MVILGLVLGCAATDAPTLAPTVAPVDPPAASVGPHDAWLAEDKLRHFTLSFGATALAYGVVRTGLEREAAVPVAAGIAGGLGLAKEVRDRAGGGRFSFKDLLWDTAGVAIGVAYVSQIR